MTQSRVLVNLLGETKLLSTKTQMTKTQMTMQVRTKSTEMTRSKKINKHICNLLTMSVITHIIDRACDNKMSTVIDDSFRIIIFIVVHYTLMNYMIEFMRK